MVGSSSVALQISPRLKSASPPTDTKPANPTPRALPRETSAPIMLPLCEATNTLPVGRSGSANAALAVKVSPLAGLTTPRLLGPSTRTPVVRQSSCSAASRNTPSGPDSANPLAKTVTSLTPSRAHSFTVSSTLSVGVKTNTCSGTSGKSASVGQACSPCTMGRFGLIGYTLP